MSGFEPGIRGFKSLHLSHNHERNRRLPMWSLFVCYNLLMTFSVLFWNIWLDNQIKGSANANKLYDGFKYIFETYNPDFLGLNEVMQARDSQSPFIIDFLEREYGFRHNLFAPASPFSDSWLIGDALCSRIKPIVIEAVPISRDSPAERRGFPDCKTKAITAKIELEEGVSFNIVVAHPMHLRPYTLKDHYEATNTLNNLMRTNEFSRNTILGGDFNEPGFMPGAFRFKTNDIMNFRTGTFSNPTWRNNANDSTLIRANLDQLYWTKQSDFKLIDFKLLNTQASDHRPILATFEY